MLRFGLVGCGRISTKHADIIQGDDFPECQLVAASDVSSVRLGAFTKKYSVPGYSNFHEMMKSEQLDVVVVLTESGNHAKHCIDLAPYKKHIVVEKPMALRLSDADKMIEECDKHGIKLFVVKQNRFNRPIIKLREAIDNNLFGKLVSGSIRVRWCRKQEYYDQDLWRGTWSMDGGVLTNQASHHLDMLLWMMGPVEEVYAISSTRLVNIEVEDTAVASIKFTNGALGSVEVTTATRPFDQEGSISILGEKGIVEVGGFAMNQIKTWIFDGSEPMENNEMETYTENPPNIYGFGHKEYYRHVISAILNQGPNLIDGLSGRKSLELINAIYESIETNVPVRLLREPRSSLLGVN